MLPFRGFICGLLLSFSLIILLSTSVCDGKRKRKFDGDFEFADEVRKSFTACVFFIQNFHASLLQVME